MGIDFTTSERNQLDYLNELLIKARATQKGFMLGETASDRYWFLQFRDEVIRLEKEKAELIKEASLRDRRAYLESLL